MTGRLVQDGREGATIGPQVPCPLLVGRSVELGVLTAALDRARAGKGGVVFLVGEAGIGKSRLVQEVADVAARGRVRILRGRCVPGAEAAAFRPLADAFAQVAEEAAADADLAVWLPSLAAIVPTVAPVPAGGEYPSPVRGEAVIRLLRSVCGERGAGLLVLEDLHWADPETLEIVEHLSDNLERSPVLCLVTVRSEPDSAARSLVRRVAARRSATVAELDRLNHSQVAAMVHSCTGGTQPATVQRIAELADGVPFLVEEMLVSPGLPASFAEAVRNRLRQLSEDDRRVLVTAAAAGRHFDWRLLAAATGLPVERVADALGHGVGVQLLAVEGDTFAFRHALTAEAVFDSVIPPRREAAAAAMLAALDAGGDIPADRWEVAARLAERAGQAGRAGQAHLTAGEIALHRGALHSAVAAFEAAVRLLPEGVGRDLAVERLVEALVAAGRYQDAVAACRGLAGRLPPARAAANRLRLAGGAATASRWEEAAEQLGAARELVAAGGSPVLRAELAVHEAELALGTNDPEQAERFGREALHLARDRGLHELHCAALQLLGRCARRASLAEADGWFRQLLAVADENDLPVWRLRARHELGTIALLSSAGVEDLLEAYRLAEQQGAMATAAILDIELAAGMFGTDDEVAPRRVREHAQRAIRRATELGMDVVAGFGWLHMAGAAILTGDRAAGEAAAAAARAAAPGNRDLDGLVCLVEALGAMLADDLDRALDLSVRSADLLRGSRTVPPAQTRAAWPLLLAVSGSPDAAAAVHEIEEAGVGVNALGRGWLTFAHAVLAGRTDRERAAALAVDADELLSQAPSKLWQHLGRRFAAAGAAADDWAFPADWLAEAERWFRHRGFAAAAAACRALRSDVGEGMPAAWAGWGITPREADVLTLIIEGCSNRDIAERLVLSIRTVEKHVESLLRKTGTRTRTQLARRAGT
jgi:DNA-binding CsgD family transcriptional regulator